MYRTSRFNIALFIETSNRYSRELLSGVRNWMRENPDNPWSIHLPELSRGQLFAHNLKRGSIDGIIARIENAEIEELVCSFNVPVVNVSASEFGTQFNRVISNGREIAALGAQHLLDRGFTHFAYCGSQGMSWSVRHSECFTEYLDAKGYPVALFEGNPGDSTDLLQEHDQLKSWLTQLPKPIGIMACYDRIGQQIIQVCRELGLRVPEEISVIGQHNDELLCDLCDPPLSSVIPNPRLAGFKAASLLKELMTGNFTTIDTYEISPAGIACRQSTDTVAVDDPAFSKALMYIRKNALKGINVNDLLQVSAVSRTLLERKFKRTLNRSPYEEIQRVKFSTVQRLLIETEMTIAEISESTGFSTPEYLSAAFKRAYKISPSKYREQQR